MQYRSFGNTGIQISTLGFGAMRLPMQKDKNGESVHVDEQQAVALMQRAFELGVNYVDTAWFYCNGESELAVGKALKGWRDKVYLSTKCPMGEVKQQRDYRSFLERQLRKLDTDYIDFYHFHGIGKQCLEEQLKGMDILHEALRAKEEGLIRHISFSFHDKPEVMCEIIDTGIVESVLCQYNMLFRDLEPSISYARKKGVGVVVMGPVGGGSLVEPSEVFSDSHHRKTPELALRFVLSNRDVSCALSGMSDVQMVVENAKTAGDADALRPDERRTIVEKLDRIKELADTYCTGCAYCQPCPQNIRIPYLFQALNLKRVYHMPELAASKYARIGKDPGAGAPPSACVQCGACQQKCPQHIPIIKQLEQVRSEFE